MFNVYKGLFGYESGAYRVPLEVDVNASNFNQFVKGKWVKLDTATGKYVLAVAADAGNPTLIQLFEGADEISPNMSEVLAGVEGSYYAETDQFEGTINAGDLLTINDNSVLAVATSGSGATAVAVALTGVVHGKIKFKTLLNRPTA